MSSFEEADLKARNAEWNTKLEGKTIVDKPDQHVSISNIFQPPELTYISAWSEYISEK